jgi:hypothetical protein
MGRVSVRAGLADFCDIGARVAIMPTNVSVVIPASTLGQHDEAREPPAAQELPAVALAVPRAAL